MTTELPPALAAFFLATNTRDFTNFLSHFTPDAHVNDEASDHYGPDIATWIDKATADTKPTVAVTHISQDGNQFTITATVSGNFPGSPLPLHYHATLKDNKIATLLIKA